MLKTAKTLARSGSAPSTLEQKASELFIDAARLTTLIAICASTWMMSGYYPFARFLTLALLGASVVLTWMNIGQVRRVLINAWSPLLIAVLFLAYAAFQSISVPSSVWSWVGGEGLGGVESIRQSFAGEIAIQSELTRPFTLVPWATHNWLAMGTIGLVGLMLGMLLFQTRQSQLLLMTVIGGCGATQVFWAIIQVSVRPYEIFWGIESPGNSLPFGTFLNRNLAADFISMALFSAIGLVWYLTRYQQRSMASNYRAVGGIRQVMNDPILLSAWMLVLWLLVGMVLTFSRGGWSSFLVAIVLVPIIWQRRGEARPWRIACLVLATSVIAIGCVHFLGFGDNLEQRVGDMELGTVMRDGRWSHWADAVPAAVHYLPLGSGAGTYGYAYLPFNPTPIKGWFLHAHNQYLELLTEMGIPGCLMLAAFLWVTVRAIAKLCQSDRSSAKQALGLAVISAIAMQALHALTDFGLMMPANLLTFAVLCGAGIAASPVKQISKIRTSAIDPSSELGTHSTKHDKPKSLKKKQTLNRTPERLLLKRLGPALSWALPVVVSAVTMLAIFQLSRTVRADSVLQRTRFTTNTPSPDLGTTEKWIEMIKEESRRSPQNEALHGRLIQLYMHRAQRASFDQIRMGLIDGISASNPIDDWDRTSLDSVITTLYQQGADAISDEQKTAFQKTIRSEPSLLAARSEIALALAANPVQPRTHLKAAQIAAASGQPWRESFEHAMALAVVDPTLSLGNGLLAWAADDRKAMTEQWQRTLSVDLTHLELIYRLARLRLTDEAIVDHLMPNDWYAPYRLAQILQSEKGTEEFRASLLEKSRTAVFEANLDKTSIDQSLAAIAYASGDYAAAADLYRKAVQSNLKDPRLRYLLAESLFRSGQGKEAAMHARVAMNLAPNTPKYQSLFEQAKRLHHRSASTVEPRDTP